jgi:16S rRNA (guanine966-N2)-methyltransferase
MLRVISGKYKSRQIKEVKSDNTRPTTDKNKEILFNTLGQYFSGGRVLDLFAGSGALGIEAYSRGFSKVDFIDNSSLAIKTIKANVETLKINLEDIVILKQDAIDFLKKTSFSYDLIIIDPPYKMDNYLEILDLISSRQLLNENGIIVMESDNNHDLPLNHRDLSKYKEKLMGYSKFSFYKKETNI